MGRWAVLLAFVLLAPWVRADRLLLDAGRDTVAWQGYDGGEFPGATATVAVTAADAGRSPALAGQFTFGGESRYAGVLWSGRIPESEALGFGVRLPDHKGGMVRVRDATGQELLTGFEVPQDRWSEVTVPLKPERFGNHWGGANDGILHFPLQAVLIGVGRGPDRSSLQVANLYAVRGQVQASEALGVWLQPGPPCGIAVPGEAAPYALTVQNQLDTAWAGTVTVTARSAAGEVLPLLQADRSLPGWGRSTETVTLPTTATGYWQITAVAKGAAGAVTGVSGLAVVPPSRHGREPAPEGYFGLQSVPDLEAAVRLGAKAVRLGPGWRWAEPRQGQIRWDDYLDPQVKQAREAGMSILMTVQAIAPDWIAWKVPGRPGLESLPDPARLAEWERFVREIAARYKGQLAAIEVQNEPDLTCAWQPGLSLAEGVDYYVNLLRAARAGAKAGDPDVPIAGIDVSGGDFDGGLKFTRAVLEKAADQLDLYTGHPYSGVRYFGPDQHPLWPTANQLTAKCRQALDLLAEFGRPRTMWIGELGWGLKEDAEPLGEDSMDFAACVVQALVCGKAAPGVAKFLWFTLAGCNEGGYEYGLVRGRPAYPLPAATAYATAAYQLDDTRPVELVQPAADVWRASFRNDRRGDLVAVWWSQGEPVLLQPPADAPAGQWVNSFGTALQPGARGVPCGRLPVYWIVPLAAAGSGPERLRQVQIVPPEPVSLVSAYLTSTRGLALKLTNRTDRPQELKVDVQGVEHATVLRVGPEPQTLPLELPRSTAASGAYAVPVEVRLTGGIRLDASLKGTLEPFAAPPAGLTIDGDLAEWGARPPFVLDQRQSLLPADPGIGWDGPQDLSVRAWLATDAEALTFAAEVTDDVHAAPNSDENGYWGSDSIQIAIDPRNDGSVGYDADDREVGLVLGADGRSHAHLSIPGPATALPEAQVSIRRLGTRTIYEARLPWRALKVSPPVAGQVLALNFVVNENDGQGRSCWLGLTPGIGEGKTPGSFRRFAVVAP